MVAPTTAEGVDDWLLSYLDLDGKLLSVRRRDTLCPKRASWSRCDRVLEPQNIRVLVTNFSDATPNKKHFNSGSLSIDNPEHGTVRNRNSAFYEEASDDNVLWFGVRRRIRSGEIATLLVWLCLSLSFPFTHGMM